MIKKLFPLFFFVFLLAGCGEQQDINTKIEKVNEALTTSSITVPSDLITTCDAKYYEIPTNSDAAPDCDTFGGGPVCSYYKEIAKGVEKTKLLEYRTECHACRTYGKTGKTNMGTTELISIGWTKGPCTQGMYKK